LPTVCKKQHSLFFFTILLSSFVFAVCIVAINSIVHDSKNTVKLVVPEKQAMK